MTLRSSTRLQQRDRDPFRLRDFDHRQTRIRTEDRPRIQPESDIYSGPRSLELNRTDTRLTSDTTARMLQGSWPSVGFQSGRPVDAGSWTGGDRLDSPQKIRQYIEERTKDLPPTAQSLDQIAKEVTARGGTIAIATHLGGTKQSDDAIILEDGSTIDLIGNVGSPDAKWQWLHHGQSYGATYDPNRKVVDPRTGELKTFSEFLTERGKPVPPYVPLIDDGGGAAAGGLDHMSGWIVDADKTKKKEDQDEDPQPMKSFFMRWMQENGLEPSIESLQKFVEANPDWEIDGDKIRIKPEALHKYPGQEAAGQWHQAITTGADGKPAWSFTKVEDASAPNTAPATGSPADPTAVKPRGDWAGAQIMRPGDMLIRNNLNLDPSRHARIRV